MTKLVVVGATGLVGRKFLEWGSKMFPDAQWEAVASPRSKGKVIQIGDQSWKVQSIEEVDWSKYDVAFYSAGSDVSKKWTPETIKKGCRVIDNTSAFRMNDDVPLVVPEINESVVSKADMLISNPNCSTIQMLIALDPIKKLFGIHRITVSTYQSLSGAGQSVVDRFNQQSIAYHQGDLAANPYQCSPYIGEIDQDGYSIEEKKMMRESQKIWQDDNLDIEATAVRVPSLYCHGESICVETKNEINLERLMQSYHASDCIRVSHDSAPVISVVNSSETVVGRVRLSSHKNRIHLWVLADNVIRGAVFNALKIYEKCFIIKKEVEYGE